MRLSKRIRLPFRAGVRASVGLHKSTQNSVIPKYGLMPAVRQTCEGDLCDDYQPDTVFCENLGADGAGGYTWQVCFFLVMLPRSRGCR